MFTKKGEEKMSEAEKLKEEYLRKLKNLQDNCPHTNTRPYSNHMYTSDYCTRCERIINIVMR